MFRGFARPPDGSASCVVSNLPYGLAAVGGAPSEGGLTLRAATVTAGGRQTSLAGG
ncbi:hypothetical protein GCM10010381_44680 [Streptomyces xantholiticus]|nr:hypothetical protein GCM10010381_44680 [Streptomyces xantholiticus]